jgi:hypothetical protein
MNRFLDHDVVHAVESALSEIAREEAKAIGAEPGVAKAFAAGDWAGLKVAVADARDKLSDAAKHNIADAAGAVSHTSQGQPISADKRLDAAAAELDKQEKAADAFGEEVIAKKTKKAKASVPPTTGG